ncbi:hypothetical protein An16g06960 [Aspergillus niger]|uniref:Uncharacterized protein n=2 Tax=Aspergillus niger TaxID=5061 RepID=A2R8F6_ASPNC|nr:hypothetical protein An16g06960 [Aspergillus niger]CAK47018.1 hypothetical protein An16g06960 [Aspergillus niger]
MGSISAYSPDFRPFFPASNFGIGRAKVAPSSWAACSCPCASKCASHATWGPLNITSSSDPIVRRWDDGDGGPAARGQARSGAIDDLPNRRILGCTNPAENDSCLSARALKTLPWIYLLSMDEGKAEACPIRVASPIPPKKEKQGVRGRSERQNKETGQITSRTGDVYLSRYYWIDTITPALDSMLSLFPCRSTNSQH